MDKIEYYKTYEVKHKLPTKVGNIIVTTLAWPACSDDGKLVWTHCKNNCTIIPNEYIIDYKLSK